MSDWTMRHSKSSEPANLAATMRTGAGFALGFTRRTLRQWRHAAGRLTTALVAPDVIQVTLLVTGVALGVGATLILFGLGWAMYAGCIFAFALAALIARGTDA